MQKGALKNHFNTVASGVEHASYEERRWAANPRMAIQQEATERFIATVAVPHAKQAHHISELGPGPGTWTKLLYAAAPEAAYRLLDISREMLTRARAALPNDARVELVEGDFTTLSLPANEADLFFSSRALEYVVPKDAAVRMIMNHLAPEGVGVIITKMPKRIANKLRGHQPSAIHEAQIYPRNLVQLLQEEHATNIRIYPVTLSFPFLRSVAADKLLGSLFSLRQLSFLSAPFAESYAVVFVKP